MTTAPDFEGWPANTYTWLAKIAKNNNKPWFTENRRTYDEMRAASLEFVEILAQRLGSEGEGKVWRIHRDARFSKGDPYKTEHDFGVADGTGWIDGMRIESTGVTVAVGSLTWSKEQLVRYREAASDPKTARTLIKALNQAEAAGYELGEPELKRPLRDLPENHPNPDLTRQKGLFLTKTHSKRPSWIFEAAAVDHVLEDLNSLPLLRKWVKSHVLSTQLESRTE